jgi:hypothetical protein
VRKVNATVARRVIASESHRKDCNAKLAAFLTLLRRGNVTL